MAQPVTQPPKSILWVDDEGELLEPHRIFLRSKGYAVEWASNADDAVELLRRHSYDILLLDEQMPGKRGLETFRDVRELAPNMPVVMVTKSEEDATLKEAISVNVELDRDRNLDWRGWIERYDELMRWDVDLAAAGEMGLYDSLRGLYADMHREFAQFIKEEYPVWVQNLEGNRPPLSVDIVGEFLLPIMQRDRAAVFVVIDCLRLDQWRVLEPLLAPYFDVETTHYYAVLPTATPYSRNALFSGLFPGEIAARLPDLWGNPDREDESLNAHEKELLESHLEELTGSRTPVRYQKISTAGNSDELERHLGTAIAPEGISAFVFNFVDLLTHGRSESQILYEVARDEIALRAITRQWFQRSALFSVLKEASRRKISVLLTTDHGSIHCNTPATVFAKRDASANLRYKFGEDLRAERPEQALLFTKEDMLRLPRRGAGSNTLLATNDCFFVYPTKLREYQSRYRGSFLHGGVSPEEVILPLALLTPTPRR